MKRLYHRVLKSLNFDGRDWAVLLLALLLAFSTWMIHNLALRYNDYLKVGITAVCNLDGHSDVSSNRCEVMARCRTTGYNVLKYNMRTDSRTKRIEFSPSVMKKVGDEMYYVLSSDLQEYSHLIFGDKVTVEYFVTDTLFFRFPEIESKRVPVMFVHSISFRPQYINDGIVECVPDSITLTGERYRLENIDRVFTKPVKQVDLHEDISGMAEIEKIRGVRFSVPEVRYSLDVTRYVELKGSYPVMAVNVPSDKKLVSYPSYAEAVFKCRYPLSGNPVEEVSLAVDYNSFMESLSGKCRVKIINQPESIISCVVNPPVVDCVLEDR